MYIDIQFEDGTIKENVRYDNFKNGNISNPNAIRAYIGKEAVANNGQSMRIIEYRSSTDIDIQFEDETIRTGIRYDNFLNGAVVNPNKKTVCSISDDKERVKFAVKSAILIKFYPKIIAALKLIEEKGESDDYSVFLLKTSWKTS